MLHDAHIDTGPKDPGPVWLKTAVVIQHYFPHRAQKSWGKNTYNQTGLIVVFLLATCHSNSATGANFKSFVLILLDLSGTFNTPHLPVHPL